MYQVRQCTSPGCALRFPTPAEILEPFPCPHCAAPTRVVQISQNSPRVQVDLDRAHGPQVDAVLDNIRSAWNVGSMLRSADGAGLHQVHLCGITPTPDNPKTLKTALGAEGSVPWDYQPDGLAAAQKLKAQGCRLWALEGGTGAASIFQAVQGISQQPVALVVGNEVAGVDPGILEECERIISIPMLGFKRSLNVAIAFGIAVYILRFSSCL